MNSSLYLNVADKIGEKICQEAYWYEDRCNWVGRRSNFHTEDFNVVNSILQSLGPTLYDGTSGIALFLGLLYNHTKNSIFRKTAIGAINHTMFNLNKIDPKCRFGFYSGKIGIAYVLYKLGLALDQKKFLTKSRNLINSVSTNLKKPHFMDVISGNAGAIAPLIKMNQLFKDDKISKFIIDLGDELLSSSHKETIGWSWDEKANGIEKRVRNITGFAHGTAGIGYGLLALYDKTRKKEFLKGAKNAFLYENNYFNKNFQNWPDFRNESGQTNLKNGDFDYPIAWCYGAPGIGISRLRASKLINKKQYLQDIKSSIKTSLSRIENNKTNERADYSLCHGVTGICDFLLHASEITGDKSYLSSVSKIARKGIDEFSNNNETWPLGTERGFTPGLMLGLSGIGYFYLRLSSLEKVESILV